MTADRTDAQGHEWHYHRVPCVEFPKWDYIDGHRVAMHTTFPLDCSWCNQALGTVCLGNALIAKDVTEAVHEFCFPDKKRFEEEYRYG